jgi:tRNA modification GTPase
MRENYMAIAAIATPVGVGGISVVRISGEGAFPIADKVFLGRTRLSDAASHTAHFGKVVDYNGTLIDEVVAVLYRKPSSYTCEDVVEISCHGGYVVTEKVLRQVLDAGARLAEPGEFTKRAFLNGRLDLSQAEAVGDLIHSQSEVAYRSSIKQLSGELSRKIKSVTDELVNLASLIELELDFPEENVEFANRQSLEDRLQDTIRVVNGLVSSYSVGRIYREGVRVTIAGKPNAGKSSLLNALLQENRVIVSDTPGTTRDTVTESTVINGVLFRLTDTAGLRETINSIEREGVERAQKEAEESDVVLLVIDCASRYYNGNDPSYQQVANICAGRNIKLIEVWNKIDLCEGISRQETDGRFFVSALRGDGIDLLKNGLFKVAVGQNVNESSIVVTNARHRDALSRAKKSLSLAMESLKGHKSGEFMALDLRGGLNALGEITGEVTTDDILNSIFSKFCVGK